MKIQIWLSQGLFGKRLPTVVVGSYTNIIPIMSVVQASIYNSYTDPYERFTQTFRGIQGAVIISECFQMVMGFLGLWRNAARFLSPLCGVPCVTFTGLGLYHLGFPMLTSAVEVGLPALIPMVFFTLPMGKSYLQGFSYRETFPMLTTSFVSLFESTDTFYATARYGSATPVPPFVISCGTGWLGVASFFNGWLGLRTVEGFNFINFRD
ncbi:putative nucleobase-ascorbate transporter 10 isoform X2 [Trifolium pratense]|uniref:putative nucleobase-ascorbate transporter 10 isoform X2 n=1 Tax=Trifolium pratense TaxID=57577 RepID=UPI001E694810|nr:putative nucleobase-ascorbate transporter 10 isoform X2 [Trifolium pratense]XP_045825108.1 putative nucleobase-ascorbate transporter 10 isoform X2 [Trifolium pratense]